MARQDEKEQLQEQVSEGIDESASEAEGRDSRQSLFEELRQTLMKGRKDQKQSSRSELSRDRSRTLFLLVGVVIALLLLFLVVFSTPNGSRKPGTRQPGTPNLGHKVTPGQQVAQEAGSITPLLNADPRSAEVAGNQGVTPQDVGRTARPVTVSVGKAPESSGRHETTGRNEYALDKVDFSDPASPAAKPGAGQASVTPDDFRKSSLVFVRGAQGSALGDSAEHANDLELNGGALDLPTGTRLVARLQSAVSSAVKLPVVAAIEYNYERDGVIVVPAGSKAYGSLQQADRSGYVGIRFERLEMPDGTATKINAVALSLQYAPLKGQISGKQNGMKTLVRLFTGVATGVSFGTAGSSFGSAFLADRLATNAGIAGSEELNNLAITQNIVVTVPGNTRFFLVIDRGPETGANTGISSAGPTRHSTIPTAEELRQLIELREELRELYKQSTTEAQAQSPTQQ